MHIKDIVIMVLIAIIMFLLFIPVPSSYDCVPNDFDRSVYMHWDGNAKSSR